MQHLCGVSSRKRASLRAALPVSESLVRFCALRRIKPHAPPLVRAPVNSLSFNLCGRHFPRRRVLIALATTLKGQTLQHPAHIVYSVDY